MTNKNKFSVFSCLILLCVSANVALADLSTGSVANLSGSNNISSTNPGTVTLRWTMTSASATPTAPPPGPVISSSSGIFLDSVGSPIGTNSKILSRTISPTATPTVVNITETLRIPRSVLFTAAKMGLQQINYQRAFTDCPTSSGGTCTSVLNISTVFNLAGGAASAFNVSNYKLRFTNGRVAAIVQQDDQLKAIVSINVTRTGTIRGVWEVATPATTAGQPSFKIVKTIQRQLNSVTTNQINSPLLPTDATGIYLVRFRFIDPVLEGDIPTLRYNVTALGAENVKQVKVISPSDGATFTPDTVYKWEPIPGANAYKLEIIELAPEKIPEEGGNYKPVTGLLLKANDAETVINKAVAQHLSKGKTYWWHVIGLNSSGVPVGQSNWASIRVN